MSLLESVVERYTWPFPLEDKRTYSATYIGRNNFLNGHGAILHKVCPGVVAVQFNDIQTGLGFYWWKFREDEFVIDPKEELP